MNKGTTFAQFKNCLRNEAARRQLGLSLSPFEAEELLADDAGVLNYYNWWQSRGNDAPLDLPPEDIQDQVKPSGAEEAAEAASERAKRSAMRQMALPLSIGCLALLIVALGTVGSIEIIRLNGELVQLRSNDADINEHLSEMEATAEKTANNFAAAEVLKMDVKATYDKAIGSIVTVHCGGGIGSGFAYDVAAAVGYASVVVTNHHVIADCTWSNGPDVSVKTHSGETPGSKLWNWDEKNDLALIMTTARLDPLAEAGEGEIGDAVIAIGSPQGFAGSVTSGIVSNVYSDAYQTDAAINHGNSGGPLLDSKGRVLGVTTLGIDREGLNIAFRPAILCQALIVC